MEEWLSVVPARWNIRSSIGRFVRHLSPQRIQMDSCQPARNAESCLQYRDAWQMALQLAVLQRICWESRLATSTLRHLQQRFAAVCFSNTCWETTATRGFHKLLSCPTRADSCCGALGRM